MLERVVKGGSEGWRLLACDCGNGGRGQWSPPALPCLLYPIIVIQSLLGEGWGERAENCT